jgi:hypothetical protein
MFSKFVYFLFKQSIIEIENKIKEKKTMQSCIYYKYYIKIIFFILKNKVHLYKRLKKFIDKS